MTAVLKQSYTLIAWPWREMPWVRVPDGLSFVLYEVGSGVAVPSDSSEEIRWRAAHEVFQGELRQAEGDLRYAHGVRRRNSIMADNRVLRLHRYDLLPGRQARSRRAFARCEARMRAAEEVYRPVRAEIEQRLAQVAADPTV